MATIQFDTLAYSKKLQSAGIPIEQAEAMTTANADAFKDIVHAQDLATKQDLAILKQDLEASILSSKQELETSIVLTKQELANTKKDLEASILSSKQELEASISLIRQENVSLKQELEASISLIRQENVSSKQELEASIALIRQENVSTKKELEAAIKNSHNEMNNALNDVKHEILKYMVTGMITLGAMLVAILAFSK